MVLDPDGVFTMICFLLLWFGGLNLWLSEEVLNLLDAELEVDNLVLEVVEVVNGPLDPVEKHDYLHGLSQGEFVARCDIDDESGGFDHLRQDSPDKAFDLVEIVDLLLLLPLLIGVLDDLALEEVVPSVKLDSPDALERFVFDVVQLLVNLAILEVQLVHELIDVLVNLEAKEEEAAAEHEADSCFHEKLVENVAQNKRDSEQVTCFPDEANKSSSRAQDSMDLTRLVVLAGGSG